MWVSALYQLDDARLGFNHLWERAAWFGSHYRLLSLTLQNRVKFRKKLEFFAGPQPRRADGSVRFAATASFTDCSARQQDRPLSLLMDIK